MINQGIKWARNEDERNTWTELIEEGSHENPLAGLSMLEYAREWMLDASDFAWGPMSHFGFSHAHGEKPSGNMHEQYLLLTPWQVLYDRETDGKYVDMFMFDEGSLRESARRAAKSYRRECGWDFAPDPDNGGWWLLRMSPDEKVSYGGVPGEEMLPNVSVKGRIVGMLVAHNRGQSDDDEKPDTISHIWVASNYRRRGVASGLVSRSRMKWGQLSADGRYSDDGMAFAKAVGIYASGK